MNGRLYRLTPAGGKPNHYTDSYASALGQFDGLPDYPAARRLLDAIEVGESKWFNGLKVERVA